MKLLIGWALVFVLGVAIATPVALGVRRDTRAGEVTIPVSLGEASALQTQSFRVWTAGAYNLFISTVNFDQARVGSKFTGEVRVIVSRPGGETLLDRRFGPGTFEHSMPYNYGDTKLATIPLHAARIRSWTVSVEVTRADPSFTGVRSEIKLWRERTDLGMGGMITYVLIFPAIVFLLLAVVLSGVLLRRGRRAPILVSVIAAAAFLLAVSFR